VGGLFLETITNNWDQVVVGLHPKKNTYRSQEYRNGPRNGSPYRSNYESWNSVVLSTEEKRKKNDVLTYIEWEAL